MHVLWRKLDGPGLDACRIRLDGRGVRLDGCLRFLQDGQWFRLCYSVTTDARLRTRMASVRGHAGPRTVATDVRVNDAGQWTLDGHLQPQVAGCVDLDLAFTPATNLLALRRLDLRRGDQAAAPAAYLAPQASQLTVLPQVYKRESRLRYRYEAPSFDFRATLVVSASCLVLEYPGLFEAVAGSWMSGAASFRAPPSAARARSAGVRRIAVSPPWAGRDDRLNSDLP